MSKKIFLMVNFDCGCQFTSPQEVTIYNRNYNPENWVLIETDRGNIRDANAESKCPVHLSPYSGSSVFIQDWSAPEPKEQ